MSARQETTRIEQLQKLVQLSEQEKKISLFPANLLLLNTAYNPIVGYHLTVVAYRSQVGISLCRNTEKKLSEVSDIFGPYRYFPTPFLRSFGIVFKIG